MQDKFLKKHFNQSATDTVNIYEDMRISAIHFLIPDNWHSLIDVGCGDGRVSNPLFRKGYVVLGVDWAENSLQYCEFPTVCGDITRLDIADNSYDGAICSEVLEHLTHSQQMAVIETLRRITRYGFIISVPAHEILDARTVNCTHCKQDYHIYGHLQAFKSFADVDSIVGQPSVARSHVTNASRDSVLMTRLRRFLGLYSYVDNGVCPYCGTSLDQPVKCPVPIKIFLRLTRFLVTFTQNLRHQRGGWFICQYSTESKGGELMHAQE